MKYSLRLYQYLEVVRAREPPELHHQLTQHSEKLRLSSAVQIFFSNQAQRWFDDLFCRQVKAQQAALLGTLTHTFLESLPETDATVVVVSVS